MQCKKNTKFKELERIEAMIKLESWDNTYGRTDGRISP